MINSNALVNMNGLNDHQKLCRELLEFFYLQDGIDAAFISGSGCSGGMDIYSDLDLGFLCSSEDVKEKIWSQRWDWNVPARFHRMDADHIKPYFIIYLFDPHIHVDLCLYTKNDLPTHLGGPFTMAFDKKNQLNSWLAVVNVPLRSVPDWSNVVHEDERFWTWMHYSWGHTARGEYYDDASFIVFIRGIVETWHARLNQQGGFTSRRLEQRDKTGFSQKMKDCFPQPNRTSMKNALIGLIEIHSEQRRVVEKLVGPSWTTTQNAIDKITALIKSI